MNIEVFNPKRGEKYSPNLYKWLRKRMRQLDTEYNVFTGEDGRLYVGYVCDGSFCGCLLNRVLCRGAKSESGCYGAARHFTLVPDFWERYAAVGRCAIDSTHRVVNYLDVERFIVDGDTRECRWCGHKQVKKTRQVVTVETYWDDAQ